METDAERDDADPPSDRDDYDIVIFHSDSETDMATGARDSVRTIQLEGRPPLRVEILADLMLPGTQAVHVLNDLIDRATIVMFFRTETFFCEKMNGFAVGAAIQDRVEHVKRERNWSVIPLDVKAKTKIKGNCMINSLKGCTINEKGELLNKSEAILKQTLMKKLPAVHILPVLSERRIQEEIADGRRRQGTEIPKLLCFPGGSTAALQPQDPRMCRGNNDDTSLSTAIPSLSTAIASLTVLPTYHETNSDDTLLQPAMPTSNSNNDSSTQNARLWSLPQCVVADASVLQSVQQQQHHENVLVDQQSDYLRQQQSPKQQLPQLRQYDHQIRERWDQQGARPKIPNAYLNPQNAIVNVPLFSSPPLNRDKGNDYLGQTGQSETSYDQPRLDWLRPGKLVKASCYLENSRTDEMSASAALDDQLHLNDRELHDAMEMMISGSVGTSLHSEDKVREVAIESLDWKDLQNDCSHVHNTVHDRVGNTRPSEPNEGVSLNVLSGSQSEISCKTTTSLATPSSLANTLNQVRESAQLPLEAGALQLNLEALSKLSLAQSKSSTAAPTSTKLPPQSTLQQPLQSPPSLQVIGNNVDVADDCIERPQPPQQPHHQPEQQPHLTFKDLPQSIDYEDSGVESNYNSTQSE